MGTLVERVAFRFKQAEIDGLYPMLGKFHGILEFLDRKAEEIKTNEYKAELLATVGISVAFELARRQGLSLLFLGLLQQRQMSSVDRKVIERAAKTFAKGSVRRPKPGMALEAFRKTHEEYRLFFETAHKVLTTGQTHTEDTIVKAGPFNLINAGGFDDKTMEDVAKAVEKAARLLASKGLSKVCYGDIQVTNTIGRSTRVLAFYLINKDEMFVRANLRGKQGPAVMSIVHELGHRLHYKFLRSKDMEIKRIYAQISNKNDLLLSDPTKAPKPGDTYEEKGKVYQVTGLGTNRKWDTIVNLELVGDPSKKARITLKGFLGNKGVSAFVSPYASTEYGENFAEMIAHYCNDTLPNDQIEMLKAVL